MQDTDIPMTDTAVSRRFVPQHLDASDWLQLEPLYAELRDREIDSLESLHRWLSDFSELSSVVSEQATRRRIAHACHTDDPDIERAYMHFVEQIVPRIRPMLFQLQKRFLEAPQAQRLEGERFEVLQREWQAEVDLFREANIPLQTQVTKLVSEYDKLAGAMTVEFRGEQYTLQQMARFLEEPDRSVRQQAWTITVERRLQDCESIESIFDDLFELRKRIAAHADKPDYRAYVWQEYGRFDYTPEACHDYADAVEQLVVPLIRELDEQRRSALDLEALRPWDLAVDVHGRDPLRPFEPERPQGLVEGVRATLECLCPSLAEEFAQLKIPDHLDLESRPGKRAGGFQAALEESGEPFIFMNAAGVHRDVETLLHEAGHAFHFRWAHANEPLAFLRHAPMEFCEVASMALELMAGDYLDVFYPVEEELARARRTLLTGAVRVLPWIATIDQFQHWLYTNPDHTPEQRRVRWEQIYSRFEGGVVDWSEYEQARSHLWHRQLHLFHRPFYYIEYGIAQLGALQMWKRFREDSEGALRDYRAALALGGGRPLPDLFQAAGLTLDFSHDTIEPVVEMVRQELAKLPE